jgi:glycosyltransferase involved in cell wall biosynthesis
MKMYTDKPKISVVMSVYNCEKYIKEAIYSILNQNFGDFEFIIINDGSTDKTREIIEEYKDERIKVINNKNKGLTKSLNEGIELAKGEYIARMDADDISLRERFEKQVEFLDFNTDIYMCGTWAEFIDENGVFLKDFKRPITDKEIKKELLFHNPFIHSSVMIRKSVFDKVGLYNESFRYAQDYELWTRVVAKLKTANLPEALLKYRVLKESITKSKNFKVRLLGIKIRLLGIWRLLFR